MQAGFRIHSSIRRRLVELFKVEEADPDWLPPTIDGMPVPIAEKAGGLPGDGRTLAKDSSASRSVTSALPSRPVTPR